MKLSIIIPLAPNETSWQQLLPRLACFNDETEVLFVSSSKQHLRGQTHGSDPIIKVILSNSGRAQSMNAAADMAQGEYLWFLHADSCLQKNTHQTIYDVINKPHQKNRLWFFDLRFLNDGPPNMSINTLGVFIRSRYFKMPFGDQAFLMKKSLFDKIGRYNETATYGEDHLLVWQAYQHGISVKPIGTSIKTSARKYLIKGRWPTTKKHLILTYSQAWAEFKKLIKIKLS